MGRAEAQWAWRSLPGVLKEMNGPLWWALRAQHSGTEPISEGQSQSTPAKAPFQFPEGTRRLRDHPAPHLAGGKTDSVKEHFHDTLGASNTKAYA